MKVGSPVAVQLQRARLVFMLGRPIGATPYPDSPPATTPPTTRSYQRNAEHLFPRCVLVPISAESISPVYLLSFQSCPTCSLFCSAPLLTNFHSSHIVTKRTRKQLRWSQLCYSRLIEYRSFMYQNLRVHNPLILSSIAIQSKRLPRSHVTPLHPA